LSLGFAAGIRQSWAIAKLLIHDRDTEFAKSFYEVFSTGKRDVKASAFRSSKTNA
jgi:hypothetical protein